MHPEETMNTLVVAIACVILGSISRPTQAESAIQTQLSYLPSRNPTTSGKSNTFGETDIQVPNPEYVRMPIGLPSSRAILPSQRGIESYWNIVAKVLNMPIPSETNKTQSTNKAEVYTDLPPLKTLLTEPSQSLKPDQPSSSNSENPLTEGRNFQSFSTIGGEDARRKLSSKVLKSWPLLKAKKKWQKSGRGTKMIKARSSGNHKGGPRGGGLFKPNFIPLRPKKNDTLENHVYYTVAPNSSNSLLEHHLAIVEVPKDAHGVIPLKNVHIITSGHSSKASETSSFFPSDKVYQGVTPYVVDKTKARPGVDRPFLVLPLPSRHGRRNGVNNIILPLQKAPPFIEDLNDSFDDLMGASSQVQEKHYLQSKMEVFGPPKADDVVNAEEESEDDDAPEVTYQQHQDPTYSNEPSFGKSTTYTAFEQQQSVRHQDGSEIKGMKPPSNSVKGMKPPRYKVNSSSRPLTQYTTINVVTTTPAPLITVKKRWPNVGGPRFPKWFKSRPVNVGPNIYRPSEGRMAYKRHQRRHPADIIISKVPPAQKEESFVDMLLKSRDQITKSLRHFPRWIDHMIGSESSSTRQLVQPNALPPTIYKAANQNGRWPRGNPHNGRHNIPFSLGELVRHGHQNGNAIFHNRFPSLGQVHRLRPLSISSSNMNLSAAAPNVIIREDAQIAPTNFARLPTIQNSRAVPQPSPRGSHVAKFTDPKGGHYHIASPSHMNSIRTSGHKSMLASPPKTNPRVVKGSVKKPEKHKGPPLVMFTLNDAIPLVSSKPVVPTSKENPQPKDPIIHSSTRSSSRTTPGPPNQKEKKKKYYMVKVRGNPSPRNIKNLLTSHGNSNIRVSPRNKVSLPNNGGFTPMYDATWKGNTFLPYIKIPTVTQTQTQVPTFYRKSTTRIPLQVTAKTQSSTVNSNNKDILSPTYFMFDHPKNTKKDTSIHTNNPQSNYPNNQEQTWKVFNSHSNPEVNLKTLNHHSNIDTKHKQSTSYSSTEINLKTSDFHSNTGPNFRFPVYSSTTAPNQRESSPVELTKELLSTSPPTLQTLQYINPDNNTTDDVSSTQQPQKFQDSFKLPSSNSKPHISFRRINSTHGGEFAPGKKTAPITEVKNNFKWFQGFKRQNKNESKTKLKNNFSPFKFNFGNRQKSRASTETTRPTEGTKVEPKHFSQMFIKNREEKQQDMQMSESEEEVYTLGVPIKESDDKELTGAYSEPEEFVYKWPKYVRPSFKTNYTELETIKSSVNDIIKQNSYDAITRMNSKDISPATTDESLCIEDETEAQLQLPQTAKLVQDDPSNATKNVSAFKQFRRLVNNRKTLLDAKKQQKEENPEAESMKPSTDVLQGFSTITTDTPTSQPFTMQPITSTTFRIGGKNSPPTKPTNFLSLLRKRNRKRINTKRIPKDNGVSDIPITDPTTTRTSKEISANPKRKYFTRNLNRRHRPPHSILSEKLKAKLPPVSTATAVEKRETSINDHGTIESKVREQRRTPVEGVFLQDHQPRIDFFRKAQSTGQQVPKATNITMKGKRTSFFSKFNSGSDEGEGAFSDEESKTNSKFNDFGTLFSFLRNKKDKNASNGEVSNDPPGRRAPASTEVKDSAFESPNFFSSLLHHQEKPESTPYKLSPLTIAQTPSYTNIKVASRA